MPRIARIVVPDAPHHVTQRGNNQQDVFFVDDDRQAYLRLLEQRCSAAGVRILGYCLMTNHVHLVAIPASEAVLALALGRTHYLYSQYVNRLHGRSGHLWQSRFYSCPLDEAHGWAALRYIERNPVRAGLVRIAWKYPWSSAGAHAGVAAPARLLDLRDWSANWTATSWQERLREPIEDDEIKRLRRHLHTGRPLASDVWLSKLEHRLGRRVRGLPRGRPRKAKVKRTTRRSTRPIETG